MRFLGALAGRIALQSGERSVMRLSKAGQANEMIIWPSFPFSQTRNDASGLRLWFRVKRDKRDGTYLSFKGCPWVKISQ